VVVTTRYVDLSRVLTIEDVKVKRFSISKIPGGVAFDLAEVLGKRCNSRLDPGQFIFLDEVTSTSVDATEHGLKVFSVLIDDTIGGCKLNSIQAGEHVTLSESGKQLPSSLLVFEVDRLKNRLKLVGSEPVLKIYEDLGGEPRAFQIELAKEP